MANKALIFAMNLLAKREHGAGELAAKLQQKGYAHGEITAAVSECQRLGLQSDERFVEALCRVRIRQGYGPVRIRQELQSKQITCELIEQVLNQEHDNWADHALAVWQKKYKNQGNNPSFVDLQKRQRFLLYRGFSSEIIRKIMKEVSP